MSPSYGDSVDSSFDEGRNVLVMTDGRSNEPLVNGETLSTFEGGRQWCLLYVAYGGLRGERIGSSIRRLDDPPVGGTILLVDDDSESRARSVRDALPAGRFSVEHLDDPTNLTSLGVRVSELLDEMPAAGERPVVCFDSVTELVSRVDLQNAFRFLHVMAGVVDRQGVIACYHLDPEGQDEQLITLLGELVTDVVDRTPTDGDRSR